MGFAITFMLDADVFAFLFQAITVSIILHL